MNWLYAPWPWYVAGPLIGLTVPALFLLGNKSFGISSTLRHLCAACVPAGIPYFRYDWKKETWNLLFVAGIVVGAFIAAQWLRLPYAQMDLNPELKHELATRYGINSFNELLPTEIFSLEQLSTWRTWIFSLLGGLLVGFGTRYAGGCTSGHAITGLSTLQWPSLVATLCFMLAGILTSWFLLPYLLSLNV